MKRFLTICLIIALVIMALLVFRPNTLTEVQAYLGNQNAVMKMISHSKDAEDFGYWMKRVKAPNEAQFSDLNPVSQEVMKHLKDAKEHMK